MNQSDKFRDELFTAAENGMRDFRARRPVDDRSLAAAKFIGKMPEVAAMLAFYCERDPEKIQQGLAMLADVALSGDKSETMILIQAFHRAIA